MTFEEFIKTNYSFIDSRKDSSSLWDDECGDSKKNFLKNKNKPNLYSEKDVSYYYNSNGFRCDEFTAPNDFPIVFLGCSVTEGYAIPEEKTWAHILLRKIENTIGKPIPYWNLAIAGCGIDTQANILFNFRNHFAKPKFVFSFFPPFTRVEAKFGPSGQFIFSRKFNRPLEKFFSDDNLRAGLLTKSLQYFDVIANTTEFYYAGWNYTEEEYDIIRRHDNLNLIFPSDSRFAGLKSFDLARDLVHPGPAFHQMVADKYWENIKHHFEKSK